MFLKVPLLWLVRMQISLRPMKFLMFVQLTVPSSYFLLIDVFSLVSCSFSLRKHKLVLSQSLKGLPQQSFRVTVHSSLFPLPLSQKILEHQLPWIPISILLALRGSCALVWLRSLSGKCLETESHGNHGDYLICFSSLRDHSHSLPLVQHQKTVIFISFV